jgi:uncharacterized membrane protein YiaA
MYQFGEFTGMLSSGVVIVALVALVAWSFVWKGIALWKAARLSHRNWFIALLVMNTMGLLEIAYIFLVARKAEQGEKQEG